MNSPARYPTRPGTRRKLLGAAVIAVLVPLVAVHEGERRKAYLDPVQIPTICFGYTYGVRMGDTATPEQCKDLLIQELEIANHHVSNCLRGTVPDKTRAAFVSLVYNTGPKSVCSGTSSIRRNWNTGRFQEACSAINKYVYAGGTKLKGLVIRRAEESKLCTEGLNETNTN